MATGRSGYVDFAASSFGGSQTLRVNWSETYSQSANTSDVTITSLQLKSNTWVGQAYYGNMIIKINGVTAITLNEQNNSAYLNNFDAFATVTNSGTTITGTVKNIAHNTDGSKTVAISISANGYGNPLFWSSDPGSILFTAGSQNIALTTIPRQYTLSISAGTGSTITVKRGSTTLSNGATITYGDVLTISFGTSTGYNLGTHTVNGTTFSSGGTHTVTGNVSVVSTASLKTFTLSISAGTGSSITVKRGSTTLSNGATITYGDVLTITFSASTGYAIATHTVNGSNFTSGSTHTVTGNVSVVSTATAVKSTLSASNGTFGTAQTLTVTRYSNAYTHTITYSCAGYTGTIVNKGTSTSISWTPPLNMMNGIPSATSATCTLTITTYNGNTSLGSNTTTITLSVPSSVKPSPSLSVSDAMGYASTYGGYVQGQSKAAVTVTDGNQYSATTSSRSTSANGATYTAASFTTGALVSSGTNTISTTVKDSRGRTGSASTSITVLAYTAPSISSFGVHRTNSVGTADDNGEYFVCTYTVAITALNNRNSRALTMRYRPTGGSWASVSITLNSYSQSGTTSPIAINTDNSYEVQLVLADDFSTITRSTTLSTTPSVISFKSGGKGAAFGKAAESDNLLDVAWDMMVRGDLVVGHIKVLKSGVDLNDLTAVTDAGLYTIASGVSNAPASYVGFLNISNGTNGTHQIVFGSSGIWVRSHTGWPLAWTAWKSITLS